jgi:hypothetical protein
MTTTTPSSSPLPTACGRKTNAASIRMPIRAAVGIVSKQTRKALRANVDNPCRDFRYSPHSLTIFLGTKEVQ